MPTFSQIQEEISNMLTVPDEELDDEQRQAMDDYLGELANMEEDKVDGFGQFLRLESQRAENLKQEARRLTAKAKAVENKIGWLKERYMMTLHEHGLTKVRGQVYTLSVRESKAVAVTELAGLPDEYVRRKVTEEPDKALIKEALTAGDEIPGCALVTTYSLQVR